MKKLLPSTADQQSSKTTTAKKFGMYAAVAILFTGAAAPSCGTVSGVGRDVQRGGEVIQNAASR